MTNNEKVIFTTMDTPDGDKAVAAMQEILEKFRALDNWPVNGNTITLEDGRQVDIISQSGSFEAFSIVVRARP